MSDEALYRYLTDNEAKIKLEDIDEDIAYFILINIGEYKISLNRRQNTISVYNNTSEAEEKLDEDDFDQLCTLIQKIKEKKIFVFDKVKLNQFTYKIYENLMLSKDEAKALAKAIIEKKPCRDVLFYQNIQWHLEKKNSVLIVQFLEHDYTGISLISKKDGINNIYIDYFCTSSICGEKQCGKNLMNFIKQYFCSHNCTIRLHSLDSATGFYEKMDFQLNKDSSYSREYFYNVQN